MTVREGGRVGREYRGSSIVSTIKAQNVTFKLSKVSKHRKDFSDHLLVILDAFVEESKLSFLEKEARNDHKHSQKERVNATKTEQRALRGSH